MTVDTDEETEEETVADDLSMEFSVLVGGLKSHDTSEPDAAERSLALRYLRLLACQPMLGATLRLILSLRLYLLVFTAPYALLWALMPDSGGWLMAAAHTFLVWYYVLSLDSAFLKAGLDPRLSLLTDRHIAAQAPIEVSRTIAGCCVALAALFLLLDGHARIALLIAAGGVGVAILVRTALRSDGRKRFVLAEWVWAVVILMGPCLLVVAPRSEDVAPQSEGGTPELAAAVALESPIICATGLGALMLGTWVLLCLRRDEAEDRSAGLSSTATLLGRDGTLGMIAVWSLGAITLSVWGLSLGWWGWLVAAAVGWVTAIVAWLGSGGSDRACVLVWGLGQGIVALLLFRDISAF